MTPWYNNNFGSVLADTLLFVRRDMLDDIIVRCTCVMYFYPSEEHLYLCDIYIYLSSQNAQKCLGHLTLCSNEVHKIRRQHQFVVKICWWRRISDCQSRQPIQSSVAGSRAAAGACGGCVGGWMRDGRWCHWTRTHDGQGGSSAHCATVTLGPARHTGEGCSGDGAGAAGVLVSLYCDVRWLTAPAGPRSWRGRGAAELNSPARARQVSTVRGARLWARRRRWAGGWLGLVPAVSQLCEWAVSSVSLGPSVTTAQTRNQAHLNTIETQWHSPSTTLTSPPVITSDNTGRCRKIPLDLPLAAPDASSRHCLSRWSITVMSRRTAVFEMTAYPINPRE